MRRDMLSVQYALKMKLTYTNPVYQYIFHPNCVELFANHQKTIATFGIHVGNLLEDVDTNVIAVSKLYAIET